MEAAGIDLWRLVDDVGRMRTVFAFAIPPPLPQRVPFRPRLVAHACPMRVPAAGEHDAIAVPRLQRASRSTSQGLMPAEASAQ